MVKRYSNFMLRTSLLAILTAIASLLSTLIGTRIVLPSWTTPAVAFITLFIGSLFMFRRQESQITSRLLNELLDFSNTFHDLTMAGSGENREIQIRFVLDRVQISDRSQKDTLQMRISHIRVCHNLIEKWFRCHKDEVEYFTKNPKLIDVNNTTRLVNDFKEIVSYYLTEVTNASIDLINDVKSFPKDVVERFEAKFDAFKSKYNYFGNQFNDYIKRLNRELSYKMDGIQIISKVLEMEKT